MRQIEFTIERDLKEEEKKPCRQRSRYRFHNGEWGEQELCCWTDFEVRVVRLDDDVTIETVYTDYHNSVTVVPSWLGYLSRDLRHRRSPQLLSLRYHTTTVYSDSNYYSRSWRNRQKHKPRFKDPISNLSICVGGSHCLVYHLWNPNESSETTDISMIRSILEDRRVTVVGMGMERFAKKAKEEWGVAVANPVELVDVAQKAFGKCHVRKGMDVEEIARVVLDGMGRLLGKPRKIKDDELWGFYKDVTEEMLMYETADLYLAFEIAKKSFQKSGSKI